VCEETLHTVSASNAHGSMQVQMGLHVVEAPGFLRYAGLPLPYAYNHAPAHTRARALSHTIFDGNPRRRGPGSLRSQIKAPIYSLYSPYDPYMIPIWSLYDPYMVPI